MALSHWPVLGAQSLSCVPLYCLISGTTAARVASKTARYFLGALRPRGRPTDAPRPKLRLLKLGWGF